MDRAGLGVVSVLSIFYLVLVFFFFLLWSWVLWSGAERIFYSIDLDPFSIIKHDQCHPTRLNAQGVYICMRDQYMSI